MSQETKGTAVIQSMPVALQLSEQAIETTKRNIQLCEQLVREVLERDIDFGTIPGVPQPFLWDSGAAKIMAAFNCYPEYKVIEAAIQVPHIRYTVSCHLINRQSQQVIATGIGAAYTKEVKHRYRWVEDPEKEGISRKGLKQNRYRKYRIPNPDTEDLLNTIAKMAAKRADVDAAQSLPGVAATLRKLFQGRPIKGTDRHAPTPSPSEGDEQTSSSADEKPTWRWFAAKLQTLGVSHPQARDILGVNSIKDDWVGIQHRTLNEAYDIIKAAVSPGTPPEEAVDSKVDNVVDRDTGEIIIPEKEIVSVTESSDPLEEEIFGADPETGEIKTEAEVISTGTEGDHRIADHVPGDPGPGKAKRDPLSIRSINELLRACHEDWNMQPADVSKELGYSSTQDISELPAECYRKIAAARGVE